MFAAHCFRSLVWFVIRGIHILLRSQLWQLCQNTLFENSLFGVPRIPSWPYALAHMDAPHVQHKHAQTHTLSHTQSMHIIKMYWNKVKQMSKFIRYSRTVQTESGRDGRSSLANADQQFLLFRMKSQIKYLCIIYTAIRTRSVRALVFFPPSLARRFSLSPLITYWQINKTPISHHHHHHHWTVFMSVCALGVLVCTNCKNTCTHDRCRCRRRCCCCCR